MVDIKEFVFRHMHGSTVTGRTTSYKPNRTEVPRELIDPEKVGACARFLFEEIYLEGKAATLDQAMAYDNDRWNKLAKEFITDIVPSNTFMHDALTFFNEIREGKR